MIKGWDWYVLYIYLSYIPISIFLPSCAAAMEWDSESVTSVTSNEVFKPPANPERETRAEPRTPQKTGGVRLHDFVSKTVRMPHYVILMEKQIFFY